MAEKIQTGIGQVLPFEHGSRIYLERYQGQGITK